MRHDELPGGEILDVDFDRGVQPGIEARAEAQLALQAEGKCPGAVGKTDGLVERAERRQLESQAKTAERIRLYRNGHRARITTSPSASMPASIGSAAAEEPATWSWPVAAPVPARGSITRLMCRIEPGPLTFA